MKRTICRLLIICLLIVFSISSAAYAALDSSQYLQYYVSYITKTGNTIKVNYIVQGTNIMDNVGVTEIYLYERENSSDGWQLVETYLNTDPAYSASMMGTNTSLKADYVSYDGNASYQYMAYVTVYAEKDGGSDSRGIVAN